MTNNNQTNYQFKFNQFLVNLKWLLRGNSIDRDVIAMQQDVFVAIKQSLGRALFAQTSYLKKKINEFRDNKHIFMHRLDNSKSLISQNVEDAKRYACEITLLYEQFCNLANNFISTHETLELQELKSLRLFTNLFADCFSPDPNATHIKFTQLDFSKRFSGEHLKKNYEVSTSEIDLTYSFFESVPALSYSLSELEEALNGLMKEEGSTYKYRTLFKNLYQVEAEYLKFYKNAERFIDDMEVILSNKRYLADTQKKLAIAHEAKIEELTDPANASDIQNLYELPYSIAQIIGVAAYEILQRLHAFFDKESWQPSPNIGFSNFVKEKALLILKLYKYIDVRTNGKGKEEYKVNYESIGKTLITKKDAVFDLEMQKHQLQAYKDLQGIE